MNNTIDHLRYPAGRFSPKESYSPEERMAFIQTIRELPAILEDFVKDFTEKQWDTPYRDGGWTARQVVHHLADSHMNAYIRIKWTLTEETPLIKAYDEKRWAETPEVALHPGLSLSLLSSLHSKWVALLERIPEEGLRRAFTHPESGKHVSIERMLALYAWHCTHHLGHLRIVASIS
jgi:hypothetical protein